MQTRRSAKAATATAVDYSVASPRKHSTATMTAITPSPPSKKTKKHHDNLGSGSPIKSTSLLPTLSTSTNGLRDEMKHLVLSHMMNDTDMGEDLNGPKTVDTKTIGGWWCVHHKFHCATASNGILLPLIKEHGPPSFYLNHLKNKNHTKDNCNKKTDSYQSFRSLCRIVAGQQLAGNAAKTIWRRLLRVVNATEDETENLTPEATAFRAGILSDDILHGQTKNNNTEEIHKSDVLPVGDLAFRKGTRHLWGVHGHGKGGALCPKKDMHVIKDCHDDFAPYRSISSYYMYKCCGVKG
eukprot:scaffold2407_cov57-Cyclotella_meneghiniana.AAC.5